jgi:hypothetical protein
MKYKTNNKSFFIQMESLVRELNAWALGQGEFTSALRSASIPFKSGGKLTFLDCDGHKLLKVCNKAGNYYYHARANILAKEKWAPPIECWSSDIDFDRDFHTFLNFVQFILGYEQTSTIYAQLPQK